MRRAIATTLRRAANALCPPEMAAGPYISPETERFIRLIQAGERSRVAPMADEDTQPYKPVR